ncbi:SPOR domain-containing protein [Shewanella sp. CG12_big_fil_rev_8_21_14_0_65_47_15]|uniref:SPOR domain-containing protein n=1 Tax=Shewanella sp. CG12_big_fil_rev_8_21_14_0_65_47_15 TaxID=1975537 RepID=UPI000CC9A0C9|nr:SPOR domain-containing protein [Shewanella sp. CG12_big_fil_rev_8_21_14_0_65_47_15]PIW59999.1 MAG: sporulation protein [Shewanella sp. CG12_big_fil_rev_8_21_14_0_65_47_15]
MSNRDYANRRPQSGAKPRPIRATRARPTTKKAPPRRQLPIALILFAFIAVGCFGYFLWSIKDTAKQTPLEAATVKTEPRAKAQEPAATLTPKVKETERQATSVPVSVPVDEPAIAVVPKKDPNALPPQPKEEWTYLNELENKHVEVDIPDVVASRTPQQYQLQCASFRQESQANQMKAVIAFQGLEAQVRQIEGTTGTWYKVALGPYETRREAERKRHVLQNAGINGCQILAIAK